MDYLKGDQLGKNAGRVALPISTQNAEIAGRTWTIGASSPRAHADQEAQERTQNTKHESACISRSTRACAEQEARSRASCARQHDDAQQVAREQASKKQERTRKREAREAKLRGTRAATCASEDLSHLFDTCARDRLRGSAWPMAQKLRSSATCCARGPPKISQVQEEHAKCTRAAPAYRKRCTEKACAWKLWHRNFRTDLGGQTFSQALHQHILLS